MKHIIYVDNDPAFHVLFRKTLERIYPQKYSLVQIYTIQELLAQLRYEKFDMVFTDFGVFPNVTMLYDHIKNMSFNYQFIVVSSADESYVRSKLLGFEGFISKSKLEDGLKKYLKIKADNDGNV